MAPRRFEEIPFKRVAASGCRLPSRLPAGEILTDIRSNKWILGDVIGYGGFGDIYLASNNITKSVGRNTQYIIKIEPHNNGPLFVEMNFYIRAAQKHMINDWCKSQNLKRLGVPAYEGSGSHLYQGERYRFLVIPRYGIDVSRLFLEYNKCLPEKLVNNLAVQMIDALEYIHSRGYAHSDVKGSNILLNTNELGVENDRVRAYLVDYGLAYRFRTAAGFHKPFVHDERRAHEGTLEFTSRDAHHGTHSRRGDLETLGYNLLQWLCGRLPWEKESGGMSETADPDKVHMQKEMFLTDIPLLMQTCFSNKKEPANISEYMKYIACLGFETKPNYSYLKGLFRQSFNVLNCFDRRIPNENMCLVSRNKRRENLRERRPCKPVNGEIRITRNTFSTFEKEEFKWEEVLATHPDRLAKVSVQHPDSPLTPPPSPPPPSLPTYAMLSVMQKMKEKLSGISKPKSTFKTLEAKWMTPAMEEIAQLKKKSLQIASELCFSESTNTSRCTRSRVTKKNGGFTRKLSVKRARNSESDGRTHCKKKKLSN